MLHLQTCLRAGLFFACQGNRWGWNDLVTFPKTGKETIGKAKKTEKVPLRNWFLLTNGWKSITL